MSSLARFETKNIYPIYPLKNAVAYYNTSVVVVKFKVVGLANLIIASWRSSRIVTSDQNPCANSRIALGIGLGVLEIRREEEHTDS
jgi:hypothetical protein